jgi:hypothetical protein
MRELCASLPIGYRFGYSPDMANETDLPPDRSFMAAVNERYAQYPSGPFQETLDGPFYRVFGHEPRLVIQFGWSADGRLICTGVLIGWTVERIQVTATAVHNIRLGAVLDELAEQVALDESALRVPGFVGIAPVVHPGPAGHSDDHYERFAQLYLEALKLSPRAHMKWLMGKYPSVKSEATLYRWREEAEERGLLPPRGKRKRRAKWDQ